MGLVIRDARPGDREAVLEFCRRTWPEYGDYIPRVWKTWMHRRRGRVIVAELDGTAVGLAKITDFGYGEIWLEGLRVDPRYRHRGIARMINAEVAATLERMKPRSVRFCTGTANRPSRHIGRKFGFEVVARLRYFWAVSRRGGLKSEPVGPGEISEVADFIRASRVHDRMAGLISEGWVFRGFKTGLLRHYAGQGRVRVFRKRGELTAVGVYPFEFNERVTTLGFVDGEEPAVRRLIRECRYLAAGRGERYCSVVVPSRGYPRLAEAAGYARKDSVGQVVMELRAGRSGPPGE
jgi:GNAT superfamily N-acetyltransferase